MFEKFAFYKMFFPFFLLFLNLIFAEFEIICKSCTQEKEMLKRTCIQAISFCGEEEKEIVKFVYLKKIPSSWPSGKSPRFRGIITFLGKIHLWRVHFYWFKKISCRFYHETVTNFSYSLMVLFRF